ncbi:hypothetical protein ACFLIM_49480 [Nonomuraea sp. M3C6]|uniref:Uncharacterized protein n=1 Tax=Nonomuraea marmarensis TaxID=3351344 RepID=A0ABW7AUZ4_9ACTN
MTLRVRQPSELIGQLAEIAAGLEVTVLDPDLGEDGSQAALLANVLVSALT